MGKKREHTRVRFTSISTAWSMRSHTSLLQGILFLPFWCSDFPLSSLAVPFPCDGCGPLAVVGGIDPAGAVPGGVIGITPLGAEPIGFLRSVLAGFGLRDERRHLTDFANCGFQQLPSRLQLSVFSPESRRSLAVRLRELQMHRARFLNRRNQLRSHRALRRGRILHEALRRSVKKRLRDEIGLCLLFPSSSPNDLFEQVHSPPLFMMCTRMTKVFASHKSLYRLDRRVQ